MSNLELEMIQSRELVTEEDWSAGSLAQVRRYSRPISNSRSLIRPQKLEPGRDLEPGAGVATRAPSAKRVDTGLRAEKQTCTGGQVGCREGKGYFY